MLWCGSSYQLLGRHAHHEMDAVFMGGVPAVVSSIAGGDKAQGIGEVIGNCIV